MYLIGCLAHIKAIQKELDEFDNISNENEKIKQLTNIIDKQINPNKKPKLSAPK